MLTLATLQPPPHMPVHAPRYRRREPPQHNPYNVFGFHENILAAAGLILLTAAEAFVAARLLITLL